MLLPTQMRITESIIEEVKNRTDIVQVIESVVRLKRRGRNYLGLCPFHQEKTPSFTVSPEKQIFKCYGCQKGGNVYSFLMEYKRISFYEAVEELAKAAGISLEYDSNAARGKQIENEEYYEINAAAIQYYSKSLESKTIGKEAMQYFEGRKLKQQTIASFGLGYAPSAGEGIVAFLSNKNVDFKKAVELGIIGQNENGNYYDRFRGRVIFPIHSANGRVVAFAGRILEKRENLAKYINSPESKIYFKGKILYGLSQAKDDIRKNDAAILVEGYLDVITLHQVGVKNVIAVSGTALTADQALLISRYSRNIFILFDADAAGIKAALRSLEILLKQQMHVRVISLPADHDPDSYVNTFGKDAFQEEVKRAKSFLDFLYTHYSEKAFFTTPEGTAEALHEILRIINVLDDPIQRAAQIKDLAKRSGMREGLLETELEKLRTKNTRTAENDSNEQQFTGIAQVKKSAASPGSPRQIAEQELIKLLFEGRRDIISTIASEVLPDDFLDIRHEQVAAIVYRAFDENKALSAAHLLDLLTDEVLYNYVSELCLDTYTTSDRWEEFRPNALNEDTLARHCEEVINTVKGFSIDSKITALRKQMDAPAGAEVQLAILQQINALIAEKVSLRKIYEERK